MSFVQFLRQPLVVRQSLRYFASNSAPGISNTNSSALKKTPAKAAIPVSSCPAGTVLKGVNYLKGQPEVLALPDEEYPEWLWTILEPKVYEDDGPGGKLERVQRRTENRQRIKDRNFMQTQ